MDRKNIPFLLYLLLKCIKALPQLAKKAQGSGSIYTRCQVVVAGQWLALAALPREVEWASGPLWMGPEYFAPTAVRTPNPPAHNESLHRLRYLGQLFICKDYSSCHIKHIL